MSRVLIPSDHRDWVVNFVDGYRRLGWEVTTGGYNFDLESNHYDVVHLNWPEELTGWRVPDALQIDKTIARLDRWVQRSRLIASVNNLYPHGQHRNPVWHKLYTAVYERADVIHHFSEASRRMLCAEYPSIADRNHVVRVGFNYDPMLPAEPRDPLESRRALGFGSDDLVYLVFGSLRFWSEVRLLCDAFSRIKVRNARLLVSARYEEGGRSWRD